MRNATNDTLRDQVAELVDSGRVFTNRELQLLASTPVTIHAARRITRTLCRSRRLKVVLTAPDRTEVYGPGQYADRL